MSISIDEQTGAILLDSNVPFDYDSFGLSNAGEDRLYALLPTYFDVGSVRRGDDRPDAGCPGPVRVTLTDAGPTVYPPGAHRHHPDPRSALTAAWRDKTDMNICIYGKSV